MEPAFGLLKTRMNELLMDGQAQPARGSGAEIFEADPKSLTGSLLKIREGSAVDGIGRYATVRQGQGLRMVADGGQQELKVSITGSGVAAGCHWMGREELGINVEAVIVGVMADGRTQTAKRGHRAGSVGAGVQLVAVVSNEGIEQISAITWLDGAPDESIMAVEAAVVQYKMEWVPWRVQGQEAAQLPAAALPYEAEVPQRLYGAHDVEQGDRADAAARQCDILAKLGLLRSAPSAGGVQVGELCVSAAVLGGGNAGEGEYLRQWVTEEASQGKLLDAVIAVAEAISAAQPTLLDEAAAEAAEAARCLGQEAGEGVLPKGTAGIFALALRRRVRAAAADAQPGAAPAGGELERARGELSRVRQQVEVANRQLSATARAQSGSPAPVLQGDFATPRAGGSPAGGVPSMGRAYTEEFTACG